MVAVLSDERSGDELHRSIVEAHAEMRAAQRGLFADIAEHDRRGAWRHFGAVSEENYLVGNLGVSWRTARSWVNAAHTLERYPSVAASFAAGELSEDQLQALVELEKAQGNDPTTPLGPFDDQPALPDPPQPDPPSGPDDTPRPEPDAAGANHEQDLLDLANRLSPRQLAAEARRRKRIAQEEAAAAHRLRHFDVSYDESDRRLRIFGGDLFDDQAAAVWAALTDYASSCSADPVTGEFEPLNHRFADALAELAVGRLAAREQATGRPALIVHADARVLTGEDGRAETTGYAPIAAETIRRIACYCNLTIVADDPEGRPIGVGRSRRTPPWWLADLVRRRDGHCRFPGCQRRMFVETHHIAEWDAKQGRTDLPNLVTLCTRHHHNVHEGGWGMGGDPGGELTFTGPDGQHLTSWPIDAPIEPAPDKAGTGQHNPPRPAPERPPGAAPPTTRLTDLRSKPHARAARAKQPTLPGQ